MTNLTFTNSESHVFIGERDNKAKTIYRMNHGACGWAGQLAMENMMKEFDDTEAVLA
jgi:hypothetical protein